MPLSRYRLADNQESRGNSHRARCFLKSPRGEAMHRTRTAPSEKQPAAVATKFLRLFHAVPLGHRIDGWRVCWVGGWDRSQVLFVVTVSYTHLRAHETVLDLVCRLLLEKKK